MNFSIKLLKTRFVVTWQQAPGFDMLHNKYISTLDIKKMFHCKNM